MLTRCEAVGRRDAGSASTPSTWFGSSSVDIALRLLWSSWLVAGRVVLVPGPSAHVRAARDGCAPDLSCIFRFAGFVSEIGPDPDDPVTCCINGRFFFTSAMVLRRFRDCVAGERAVVAGASRLRSLLGGHDQAAGQGSEAGPGGL